MSVVYVVEIISIRIAMEYVLVMLILMNVEIVQVEIRGLYQTIQKIVMAFVMEMQKLMNVKFVLVEIRG